MKLYAKGMVLMTNSVQFKTTAMLGNATLSLFILTLTLIGKKVLPLNEIGSLLNFMTIVNKNSISFSNARTTRFKITKTLLNAKKSVLVTITTLLNAITTLFNTITTFFNTITTFFKFLKTALNTTTTLLNAKISPLNTRKTLLNAMETLFKAKKTLFNAIDLKINWCNNVFFHYRLLNYHHLSD